MKTDPKYDVSMLHFICQNVHNIVSVSIPHFEFWPIGETKIQKLCQECVVDLFTY